MSRLCSWLRLFAVSVCLPFHLCSSNLFSQETAARPQAVGVTWSQPVDISADDAEKLILGQADGLFVVVGMYNDSVHKLDNKIEKETLRALLTINGGEVVGKF